MGTHEILYEGFLKPLLAGRRPERGTPAGKLLFVDESSAPDGEVLGPCTRAGASRRNVLTPPLTQVGTALFRLLNRLPQLGPAKDEDWWKDETYGLPVSYLRAMLFTDEAGARKGKAAMDGPDRQLATALKQPDGALPHLRLPMHVERSDKGHVAWLDGRKSGSLSSPGYGSNTAGRATTRSPSGTTGPPNRTGSGWDIPGRTRRPSRSFL